MSKLTFENTILHTDFGTFRAGDVVTDGDKHAFCHTIILGFSGPTEFGHHYVKMGRPYAYASCVGTTGPGVLTGVEEYEMPISKLAWVTVLTPGKHGPMLMGRNPGQHYDSEVIDLRTKAA